MEFTLADGRTVRITAATARALREAVPVPAYRDVLRLRGHAPAEVVRALAEQGLVVQDRRIRAWLLTTRGAGVRDLLANAPAALGDGDGGRGALAGPEAPMRVTVHPEVGADRASRLNDAVLRGYQWSTPVTLQRKPPSFDRNVGSVVLGAGAFVSVGFLFLAVAVGNAVMFVLMCLVMVVLGSVGAMAMIGSASEGIDRRTRETVEDPRRAGHALAENLRGWFVSSDMLDGPARALLRRAQTAVDSVLASSLHNQGLLLDTVRNRVVLADVEWSLADRLRDHTKTRRTIQSIATPGERSRRAAARAREVLDEDVARVEARVRMLEDYASKVSAAEMAEYDRLAAARLDALAMETGADHRQQDEALMSLVEAQELALRIATLSDELGEGT